MAKTKAEIAKKLEKAIESLAVKLVSRKPTPQPKLEDNKPYKVLYRNPDNGREVRIYSPCKRSIINLGEFHFLQFPYLIFGYMPKQDYYGRLGESAKNGEYSLLYGCFSTEDLSKLSPEELKNAVIYRMPFPAQFDRGMWGPCCLLSGSPYYYVRGEFDNLISRFWQTSFRQLGDYSQREVSNWNGKTFEEVCQVLHKAPGFYRGTFEQFVTALEGGKNPY